LATAQPGYVSGETLRNVDDPEDFIVISTWQSIDDFIVISTWQSIDDWKAWAANERRLAVESKVDALLGEKTEYGICFYG
jgi:heme-degrading monooxygenase HmoA